MAFDVKGSNNIYIPAPVICDILIHLSVEEILICRCVCKTWRKMISEPQFTKQYFAGAGRTEAYPLVRPLGSSWVSRTLYFVDPKNYISDTSSRLSLGTKFKIPLYNFESVLKSESYAKLTQESVCGKRKRCLDLTRDDHFLEICNTCIGFLCLSRFDIVSVCNPTNGEFVNISVPPVAENEKQYLNRYALGFCSETNTYKVIRIFGRNNSKWWIDRPSTGYQCLFSSSAQINILGSRQWRNIGLAPSSYSLHQATFVNGTLNWLYDDWTGPQFIVSFDFGSYCFSSFSLPISTPDGQLPSLPTRNNTRIGVLRDQLCTCNASKSGYLDIWVTSKNVPRGSWTKVCNVSLSGELCIAAFGFYQPITQLESGAILLFHCKNYRNFGMVYYDPEKQRVKYFKIKGMTAKFEAIGYTPTFISLKDVLVGNEVNVLNIYSRCAELKIQRGSSPLYLMQENLSLDFL